ncbi:hypothetical protein M8C21_019014 [Ambrosia artemisiifolia]|uniref:Wall-associated receptor kinase galacturonan-binding domain-containing protein n=1 Tax=Ambrosia artemisiifolia TaxID=4212 RepID=A0AAD5GGK7_AMBAR|nr:hypothetical protein M8C21_019014 [Ambrosia artemisiifolia]
MQSRRHSRLRRRQNLTNFPVSGLKKRRKEMNPGYVAVLGCFRPETNQGYIAVLGCVRSEHAGKYTYRRFDRNGAKTIAAIVVGGRRAVFEPGRRSKALGEEEGFRRKKRKGLGAVAKKRKSKSLWSKSEKPKVGCCTEIESRKALSSRKCHSGRNPYLPDTYTRDSENQNYAKTGCNDTCGDVRIPYPFGIGAECSINRWYIVDCNSSKPYLPALNHVEVLKIYTDNQTVIVGTHKKSSCQKPVQNSSETMSIDLGKSPFLFLKGKNKLVFEGCGTAYLMENGNVLAACPASCESVTQSDRDNCFGIGCCQITIPNFLKSYNIFLTGLKEEDGRCPSTFLVDETLYGKGWLRVGNSSFIRISLRWTLTDSDQVTCCDGVAPERSIVDMSNGTSMDTLLCRGWAFGSPYLIDGCASMLYIGDEDSEYCRRCSKRGGYCDYVKTHDDDDPMTSIKTICVGAERTPLGLILGVSISTGVVLLIAASFLFDGESRSLVTHFMLALEEEQVMSIFDATVIKEGTSEELMIVANLARRCLNIKGIDRPTMKEVFIELETIRASHMPPTIQSNTSWDRYSIEW